MCSTPYAACSLNDDPYCPPIVLDLLHCMTYLFHPIHSLARPLGANLHSSFRLIVREVRSRNHFPSVFIIHSSQLK